MDIVIALILGLFVNPSEVLDAEAEWGVYQDPIINLSANVESSDFIVLGRAEKITVSPRQYTRDRVLYWKRPARMCFECSRFDYGRALA